jgi:hypothetical protein
MPVVMLLEWAGVTLEQYDSERALVNWEGDAPAGALLYLATSAGNGLRVTDLWASAKDFQPFAGTRLMPGVAQFGLQGEPRVELYPALQVFTLGFTPKA